MRCSIPCEISLLHDTETSVVMVRVSQELSPLFLLYLDGLKLGRVGRLCLEDQKAILSFVFRDKIEITVSSEDCSLRVVLGNAEEELLRCCCVDGVLGTYDRPHVDLELGDFDLAFSVF